MGDKSYGLVQKKRPAMNVSYQQSKNSNLHVEELENQVAYSDRPSVPEPGLYNDIYPITQMVTKLAIQELIQGKNSTLMSLNEDLTAHWYLWLNRREKGTDYENLGPLQTEVNGMRIMRWYGVGYERNPLCPACGSGTGLEHYVRMNETEVEEQIHC